MFSKARRTSPQNRMCENIAILIRSTTSLDKGRLTDAWSNEHTLTTASSEHRRCRWPPGGTRVPLARRLVLPARLLAHTSTRAHLKFNAGHRANAMILASSVEGYLPQCRPASARPRPVSRQDRTLEGTGPTLGCRAARVLVGDGPPEAFALTAVGGAAYLDIEQRELLFVATALTVVLATVARQIARPRRGLA